jgi:hypothetical protein
LAFYAGHIAAQWSCYEFATLIWPTLII